jgi:general nucleoside transport system permease protein
MTLAILILAAGINSGTSMLFASIGEIFAERSGVINLGVEGMMLMGAMSAFAVSAYTGNPWLGLLVAMLVGGAFGLLHAFLTITLRAGQVVSGLALTFLGTGLSALLGAPLVQLKQVPQLPRWPIPVLGDIPYLGQLFFTHNAIVYLGFLLIPAAWLYIYRTRPGLELRAIGEYPAAADVVGINVNGLRYFYVIIGGIMAGIGGAAISLAITSIWLDGVTGGQGWIAVGLVIFAGWNPLRAAVGAYAFGALRRLALDLQTIPIIFGFTNPLATNLYFGFFLQMLPYLFTIIVLALVSLEGMRKRQGAPAALGQPYVRGERGV